jgi:uncharacterized BrkB/YihY/UPF0761 family membrane protein
MVTITIILVLFSVGYFGSIKVLGDKNKEFFQFLVMYIVIYFLFQCVLYVFMDNTNPHWHWNIKDTVITSVFYEIPPTYVASYLCYPFKTVKRNKILIWILSVYSVLILGGTALLELAVSFSNM